MIFPRPFRDPTKRGIVRACDDHCDIAAAKGLLKAGNHDRIWRFMVFTSGVCWIAGTWSPELASTAARELSS
ncbi:hypothetical protein C1H46_043730 [Malus baccata]|uniref:Uncharacterized protein n=1 Tax=Malus baccata TaxID=106549 RepID=A0A540K950_MALBA|nr:hypothetical protein C1H46_043730 [Malus baccata]